MNQARVIVIVGWIDELSVWAGYLGTFFLFIITLTIICDSFTRTLFNQPFRFGPDLLSFLAIYSILLPCAMALRNNRQIEVSVVFDKLPVRLKEWIPILTLTMALIVFSITTFYAFQLTLDSFRGGLKSNSPFGMKLWYSQFGVFLSMALLSLQVIAKLMRSILSKSKRSE